MVFGLNRFKLVTNSKHEPRGSDQGGAGRSFVHGVSHLPPLHRHGGGPLRGAVHPAAPRHRPASRVLPVRPCGGVPGRGAGRVGVHCRGGQVQELSLLRFWRESVSGRIWLFFIMYFHLSGSTQAVF